MDNNFSISIQNRDFSDDIFLPDLEYVITRYSFAAQGGPKDAVVTAYGNENELWELINSLRKPVVINDNNNMPAWWGMIYAVEIRVGSIVVGVTLESMYNKVKIIYVEDGERKDTDWAQNDQSVNEFSTKEIALSIGDGKADEAENKRDTILEQFKFPSPTADPSLSQSGGRLSARITCRGWYDVLGWSYYNQSKGLVAYNDSGAGKQKFGVSYTASTVWFKSASFGSKEDGTDRWVYSVHDTASGLKAIDKDDVIYVSGTANTGSYTVTEGTRLGDDFKVDTIVSSTASNAGDVYTITTASSILQSFQQVSTSPWNVHEIYAGIQRVGSSDLHNSENASGVRIHLLNSDGSGSVNTSIATASVGASELSEAMSRTKFVLNASATINSACPYWISLSTEGQSSGCAYYEADINDDLGYPLGQFEINNSNKKHLRTQNADMLFQVVGKMETTCQMKQMLEANTTGFFDTEYYIDISSSVMGYLYRDGESLAKQEFEEILNSGTLNNRRMLAQVTDGIYLRVYEEPAIDAENYQWTVDNQFIDNMGNPVLRSNLKQVVGKWVEISGIIPADLDLTLLANPRKFFVEEVEYFVQSQQVVPTPRGKRTPFEIGEIEMG